MNIICDVLIVAVIVLCAVVGRHKGFVKTFFDLFGTILALLAAFFLNKPLASFLSEKIFHPMLSNRFTESLKKAAGSIQEKLDFSDLPLTQPVKDVLSRFHTDADAVGEAASNADRGGDVSRQVADSVTAPFANVLSAVVAFIVIFLASILVIRLLALAFDWIAKLPVLRTCNHALGLAVGLATGVLLAILLASLFSALEPVLQSRPEAFWNSFEADDTVVLRFFAKFDFMDLVTTYFKK